MSHSHPIDAVFATPKHCLSEISGGQQLYTRELLQTLRLAGVRPHLVPISCARGIATRIRRKIRRVPYLYSYENDSVEAIVAAVRETKSSCVMLNGVTFIGIASKLRKAIPHQKLIMLSHGLDSTDYVHELRAKVFGGRSARIRHSENLLLGRQLNEECRALQLFDATLGLSQVEAEINRWLGAKHSFWLPRAVAYTPLDWSPLRQRVGFVGTLDHPPNLEGLHRILPIIRDGKHNLDFRLIGGPVALGQEFQARYPGIQYLGALDDEELAREASTWRAFLHPLFCFARGASTKLAVGLGWGLPIVATTAGRRGYEWASGSLIEANEPEAFVRHTLKLVSDDSYMTRVHQEIVKIAKSSPTAENNACLMRSNLDSILESGFADS